MHKGNIMNMVNKKSILYLSISLLILSGCATGNEMAPEAMKTTMVEEEPLNIKVAQSNMAWNQKSLPLGKIDKDCIDCYAKPLTTQDDLPRTYYAQANTDIVKSIGPYEFVETDADRKVKSDYVINKNPIPTYSSDDAYPDYAPLGSISIQVGAFRNYSGAETYREKYDKFGEQYKVEIKTGTKNNKKIHRVQIGGFKDSSEAERFITQNRLSDAFLVK
jgi:hypothetical protein